MIIEVNKDGQQLLFSVKHGDGRQITSYNLSDALYQACMFGAKTIKVSVYENNVEEVIDDIDVDELLRSHYSSGVNSPLQYAYVEDGGIETIE